MQDARVMWLETVPNLLTPGQISHSFWAKYNLIKSNDTNNLHVLFNFFVKA